MNTHRRISFLIVLLAGGISLLGAQVHLPAVFSSNMVLQRNTDVPVWGWARAGEHVAVSINGATVDVTADSSGAWTVLLKPMEEGGPYELLVHASNEIRLTNVMVGVVWFCSGQSNMELSVAKAADAATEIADAGNSMIRLFTVKRAVAEIPQKDCIGRWEECSSKTVGTFSAAAYYFGREIQKELGVAVGLIHSSYGGSPAEAWMTPKALNSDTDFLPILDRWEKNVAEYPARKKEFDAQRPELMKKWTADSAKAALLGRAAPARPQEPLGPGNRSTPSGLFNGMVAPILPYGIDGVLWYQGEANTSRAYQYRKLFPALIADWRAVWKKELPFYYVQLPNLDRGPEPSSSGWKELREAQLMTLTVPNTGMAVTIDIGDPANLHPQNKQDVGKRLARIAEALSYKKKIECSGPLYRTSQVEGSTIRIFFDHAEGLRAAGGSRLAGFTLAGSDRTFVPADATVDGNSIVVSCPSVSSPVSVRYAWADNPVCNLTNSSGLPASPFRTDEWPASTFGKK